jgi:hypothetical protein
MLAPMDGSDEMTSDDNFTRERASWLIDGFSSSFVVVAFVSIQSFWLS